MWHNAKLEGWDQQQTYIVIAVFAHLDSLAYSVSLCIVHRLTHTSALSIAQQCIRVLVVKKPDITKMLQSVIKPSVIHFLDGTKFIDASSNLLIH
ncbi:hypothetical protein ACTXT7_013704 [Hymenolepis weldensis]